MSHFGTAEPCGRGLLGALAYYGLDAIEAAEKDAMRQLVMRGGPWSEAERKAILDYCQSDVDSLARLLPVMLPRIDLPRAIIQWPIYGSGSQDGMDRGSN